MLSKHPMLYFLPVSLYVEGSRTKKAGQIKADIGANDVK